MTLKRPERFTIRGLKRRKIPSPIPSRCGSRRARNRRCWAAVGGLWGVIIIAIIDGDRGLSDAEARGPPRGRLYRREQLRLSELRGERNALDNARNEQLYEPFPRTTRRLKSRISSPSRWSQTRTAPSGRSGCGRASPSITGRTSRPMT